MKKSVKQWLLIACILLLSGTILFSGVMFAMGWDFTKLSTVKYETNEYTVAETFDNILIITDCADIELLPSGLDSVTVVCHEQVNQKHSVSVTDGTLAIEISRGTRKWYEYIGIDFGSPYITITLPEKDYNDLLIKVSTGDVVIPEAFTFADVTICGNTGDVTYRAPASGEVKISAGTGDISIGGISAASLALSVSTGGIDIKDTVCSGDFSIDVSTGKVKASGVRCKTFTSGGNTGDITLQDVVAAERFYVERSTGDVRLDRCDAAEIYIHTDTGDVTGSLLTEKVFMAETDTGDVNIPKTRNGGICEITCSTGDIRLQIAE